MVKVRLTLLAVVVEARWFRHGNCLFLCFSQDQTELNYNLDIIDNAIGFRIKDDGVLGIGY
jgi:hypothetical protein